MATATDLMSLEMCLFANHSSFSACIMALPKLTIVFLRVPLIFLICGTPIVLARVILTLFFAWNVTQSVQSSWKRSVVILHS